MTSVRTVLTATLNIEGWIILMLNFICFYCLVKGKLFQRSANPIYVIIGYNLVTDIIGALVYTIFFLPSMHFQKAAPHEPFITFLGVLSWFASAFIQVVLALNRLFAVLLTSRNSFDRRRVLIVLISVTICVLLLATLTQQVFCCRLFFDPFEYGLRYPTSDTQNHSKMFIDIPVNMLTSITCLVSYIIFFTYVFKIKSYAKNPRMANDIRLCIQCALMFLVYTTSWAITVSPQESIEARILVLMGVMLCLGANAIVYLTLNREISVQNNVVVMRMIRFCRRTGVSTVSTFAVGLKRYSSDATKEKLLKKSFSSSCATASSNTNTH